MKRTNQTFFITASFALSLIALFFVGCSSVVFQKISTQYARSSANQATIPSSQIAEPQLLQSYGKLPLSFEANQGQTNPKVKFLSRGSGYTLFLTDTEAVLTLKKANPKITKSTPKDKRKVIIPGKQPQPDKAEFTTLRMKLEGANAKAQVSGLAELPGKANYFSGKNSSQWHINIPTYAQVQFTDVYPGINLVYYGSQRQLEYDWVVRPGADPAQIKLAFEGADALQTDEAGDLVVQVAGGELYLKKPQVYQEINGNRHPITAQYQLVQQYQSARLEVRVQVAAYDVTQPLTIDPVLVYSTYLGGSGSDGGGDIAVDSSGNAYITGITNSTDFPTASPSQGAYGGAQDAFVAKLNATGSALIYSTYLGGSGIDYGYGIAVDGSGNAYVTGQTASTDFPTANPLQAANRGIYDAFVVKLNPTGSALVYSTYLGGNSYDGGGSIAVDSSGNAYVTGYTDSTNFPTASPLQGASGGTEDAFVAKLNASGSALVYSTYLGGVGVDYGNGISVDNSGNVYVAGTTLSTNFPTSVPFQDITGGSRDIFVAKLNATGSALDYSTYLGGSSSDYGNAIAVDSSGNAYVTGTTESTNFPTASPLQDTLSGTRDVIVVKINNTGSALIYSTYLGGGDQDIGSGIAVDSSGNVYVIGLTYSTDFPTASPLQGTPGGAGDAFVSTFNATGSALVYSTYLGGSGVDEGNAIAVDSSGNAYVTGSTDSTDFPAVNPLQAASAGGDVFVTKISDSREVILQPCPADGMDLWITSVYYGGGLVNENLSVGGWGDEYYSLIKFNLTGLPANTNSARIYLYAFPSPDTRFSPVSMLLDRITSPWYLNTKWDTRPNFVNIGGLPTPISNSWYAIDITNLYNQWQNGTYPNYGIQLRPTDNNARADMFYSSRYTGDASLRPMLVVQGPLPISTYTLMLATTGNGSGTVCGAGTYSSGQTATVSATPNPDSTFTGWTGPDGSECTTGSVLMDADKSCTANFTLVTPFITFLAPTSGPVGTQVTLTGYNFGATQGSSTVTFNGVQATASSWSDTQIIAMVPSSAATGPVVVTVGGVGSNADKIFTVTTFPACEGAYVDASTPAPGPNTDTVSPWSSAVGVYQFRCPISAPPNSAQYDDSCRQTSSTGGICSDVYWGTGSVYNCTGGYASDGTNEYFGGCSQITDTKPPSVPTGLTAEAVSSTEADVSWHASTDNWAMGHYVVLWGLSTTTITNVAGTVADTGASFYTFKHSGLTPSTSYYYRVKACDLAGNCVTTPDYVVARLPLNTPSISSLSPITGSIGTSVTINGSYFGTTQGSSTVTFNGVQATVTSWGNTQIIALVPAGATTGPVVVTVNGIASNAIIFGSVLDDQPPDPVPNIQATPVSASQIDISWDRTTDNVGVSGYFVKMLQGSQYRTIATIPNTGSTSYHYSNTGLQANTTYYYLVIAYDFAGNTSGQSSSVPATTLTAVGAPSISSLSPTFGLIGTNVTLTGSNFGITQGSSTVTFNGVQATASSWSDTQIIAMVPSSAATGPVVVTVGEVGSNNDQVFTVITDNTAPALVNFWAVALSPTQIDVQWNPTTDDSGVISSYRIEKWDCGGAGCTGELQPPPTQFFTRGVISVPGSATDYVYQVQQPETWYAFGVYAVDPSGNSSGLASPFYIRTPTDSTPVISSLSPISGPVGTSLIITGTNFGTTQDSSTVSFNNVQATVTSWSNTQIIAPVPAGATTGPVVVTVNGVASNADKIYTLTSSTTTLTVQVLADNSGSPLSGALVTLSDNSTTYSTDGNGQTQIATSPGSKTVFAFKDGYQPVSQPINVVSGSNNVTVRLPLGEVLVVDQVTVTPLTDQEIQDRGVDLTDPDNYAVYDLSVEMTLDGNQTTITQNSAILPINPAPGTTTTLQPTTVQIGGTTTAIQTTVIALPNGTSAYAFLMLPDKLFLLKEFFDAKVVIKNNAGADFVITGLNATLSIPAGLTLVPLNGIPQLETKSIGDLSGGSQVEVTWVVRGDTEGTYTLGVSATGNLQPFGIPLTASNTGTVQVLGAPTIPPVHSISGQVTINGTGLPGVLVTLGGGIGGTATTENDGTYTIPNIIDGSYTVSPSRSGFTFDPIGLLVQINGMDATEQNFTATQVESSPSTHLISGKITINGEGLAGANVNLIGAQLTGAGFASEATTQDDGSYVFFGLQDGTYTITPSLGGYSFTSTLSSSSSRTITVSGKDESEQDFVATILQGSIQITNIQVPQVTAYGAKITWETNIPTTGYVSYGENDPSGKNQPEKSQTAGTTHEAYILNLRKQTTYQFQVVAEVNGITVKSPNQSPFLSFTTSAFGIGSWVGNREVNLSWIPFHDASIYGDLAAKGYNVYVISSDPNDGGGWLYNKLIASENPFDEMTIEMSQLKIRKDGSLVIDQFNRELANGGPSSSGNTPISAWPNSFLSNWSQSNNKEYTFYIKAIQPNGTESFRSKLITLKPFDIKSYSGQLGLKYPLLFLPGITGDLSTWWGIGEVIHGVYNPGVVRVIDDLTDDNIGLTVGGALGISYSEHNSSDHDSAGTGLTLEELKATEPTIEELETPKPDDFGLLVQAQGDIYLLSFYDNQAIYLNNLGISQQGFELQKALEKLHSIRGKVAQDDKFILIAHSMGGLAARTYLEQYSPDPSNNSITYHGDLYGLITADTPHSGTPLIDDIRSDLENGLSPSSLSHLDCYTSHFYLPISGTSCLLWVAKYKINLRYDVLDDNAQITTGLGQMQWQWEDLYIGPEKPTSFVKALNDIAKNDSLLPPSSSEVKFQAISGDANSGNALYNISSDLRLYRSDGVVPVVSQENLPGATFPPIEVPGKHTDAIPNKISSEIPITENTAAVVCALSNMQAFNDNWSCIKLDVFSPVEIEITNPLGQKISPDMSGIPLAVYDHLDLTGTGHENSQVLIPLAIPGNYQIKVIPKPDALPTDTYTIKMVVGNDEVVIAQDTLVGSISQLSEVSVDTTGVSLLTGPDLIMTDVTPDAGTVTAGSSLSVTDTVMNQGTETAGSFRIAYHLSTDTTYGNGDDVASSTIRVVTNPFASGAISTTTTNLTIPSNTPAGTYYLCAIADSLNQIAESDETNNSRCSTQQVTVPVPDLTFSTLSTGATTVTAGSSFNIGFAIMNQGGSQTGAFVTDFHLSPDAAYGGVDDIPISQDLSLPSLGVGASYTNPSFSLVAPSTTPAGTYYLCGMTDANNTVNEGSNEGNNIRCTGTTITVVPLTVTLTLSTAGTGSGSVSGAGPYKYGQTATVSATPAAGSTFAGWSGPNGTECATGSVLVNADKSCTATFTLALPTISNFTPTSGTVGTPNVTIVGSNFTNVTAVQFNGISTAFTVPSSAQIRATVPAGATTGPISVTTAAGTVTTSSNFTVTATLTLTTAGTGSGTISGAGTYSAGQTASVSATANPGSTFTGWTGTDAAECSSGSVLMNADKSCTANFTAVAAGPDLEMTAVTPNAATARKGGRLSVTTTVSNVGTAGSSAFRIGFHLSPNAVYGDADDVVITTTRVVTSLAAGASSTGTTYLTLPGATPSGTYYVCTLADSLHQVSESNEGNNTLCSGAIVTVP